MARTEIFLSKLHSGIHFSILIFSLSGMSYYKTEILRKWHSYRLQYRAGNGYSWIIHRIQINEPIKTYLRATVCGKLYKKNIHRLSYKNGFKDVPLIKAIFVLIAYE